MQRSAGARSWEACLVDLAEGQPNEEGETSFLCLSHLSDCLVDSRL